MLPPSLYQIYWETNENWHVHFQTREKRLQLKLVLLFISKLD